MDGQTLTALLGTALTAVTGGFAVLFRSLLSSQAGRITRAEKTADDQTATVTKLTDVIRSSGDEIRTLVKAIDLLTDELRRERGRA